MSWCSNEHFKQSQQTKINGILSRTKTKNFEEVLKNGQEGLVSHSKYKANGNEKKYINIIVWSSLSGIRKRLKFKHLFVVALKFPISFTMNNNNLITQKKFLDPINVQEVSKIVNLGVKIPSIDRHGWHYLCLGKRANSYLVKPIGLWHIANNYFKIIHFATEQED